MSLMATSAAQASDAPAMLARRSSTSGRASRSAQRIVAGLAVCAGVAAAVLPAGRFHAAATWTFVTPEVGAPLVGRSSLEFQSSLTGGLPQPSVGCAELDAAASASSSSTLLRSATGIAALILLSASRRSAGAESACKVARQARSPFPSEPAVIQSDRSVAANGKAFYGWRQIGIRVNPKTKAPIEYRMHVEPGDVVQVCKGKDKGKVTTVLRTFPLWNKVLCLGVNYCIKHVRPQREDEVGQRVTVEAPMHASNIMHYSEEKGVSGRLGIRFVEGEDGKVVKERYNKATGEVIEKKEPPKWVPVLERE